MKTAKSTLACALDNQFETFYIGLSQSGYHEQELSS